MKQFRLLLTILTLLVVGSMNVYAEIKTWTLSYSDFNSNSYASNNGEHTKDGITYFSNQVMLQSSSMQFQKSKGYIYNKTPMPGNITKITLGTTTNFTIYVGTTASPSSGTVVTSGAAITGNYTYFYIKNGNATAKTATITITYEAAASCTTPAFTIADKTISLSEAETGEYDMSTNLTINTGGSTGAITYSCDNSDVLIDGNTFYTLDAGTYTINATMAADATYCEATTTFTITVQSAPCTQLEKPMGLSASVTAYNSAILSWNTVDNAAKYQITTTPPAFGGSATYTTTGTETTYTATDLSPETEYKWTVKALGDGTTYCDSEKSASSTFTTPAKPTYTITWRTPDGPSTTKVTQGDKIGTLLDAPAAPQGCPDKVFMGWSENNIGTTGTNDAPAFISAETIPTDNTTYYAVFATKERSGVAGWTLVTSESDLIAGQIYTIASSKTPNSGKVLGKKSTNNYDEADWTSVSTIPTQLTLGGSANAWTLNDGTGYLYAASSSKNYLQTQSTNDQNGQWSITFSSQTAVIKARGTNTHNTIKYNSNSKIFSCYTGGQQAVYLFKYSAGSTYTDYVTNCVECTAPTTPLALTIADATLNLGEDGTAKTTFSTTGGNGGTIDYVSNPTTGADIDKDNKTITFTQAGTYTLTAQQALNTTDGTTYCGSRVSQTITVTKNPVWNLTGTLLPFETICTEASAVQQVQLSGYNLTTAVKASLQSNSAFSLSANQTDWSKSITLPIDENGKVDATIYVRLDKSESCPTAATNPKQGTITISSTGIANLTQPVSGTISAPAVKVSLNDQETTTQITGQRLCCQIDEQTLIDKLKPIDCEDAHFSHFVTDPTKLETPIAFPYDITTTDDITFYAVYCKETEMGVTKFEKISSLDDIESGVSYIIAAPSTNEALSSTETATQYKYEALSVAIENDMITNPDASVVWKLEGSMSSGFSLYSDVASQYLSIIVSNKYSNLTLDGDAHLFGISGSADNVKIASKSVSSYNYVSLYQSAFNAFSASSTALSLYKRIVNCTYVLKPCGPYIKATGDVAITSGKGIWVESVTPLTISAKNLDKNDDKEAVTITATVTDEASANGFSIKTPGTQDSGAKSVTLASNHTDATYDGVLTVVYTPTTDDVTAEGKIALRVYKSGGSATYATDTIVVRGRSLPAEFVLAAKTANGWVALPSDLAVGSDGALKYPYSITVDDVSAPTKATQAPKTAIYMSADRYAKNIAATAVRLKNAGNQYLQGSTSDGKTNVWLSNQNSGQAQSWELRGADFTHYFVRMQASEAGRYLSYDATQGKIGNYKQEASLFILPVEKTCVRFDAPKLDVHALASTSATILWEAIAGVAEYEYSLDNGASWQTCTGVQTMGTAIQWTLGGLETQKQYTVWVRAKVADGETNCSDYDSETFTTTSCDDVPTDLWSSATANSVTITWNAQAATATVKIYSDEKGENEVLTKSGLTSPAKIVGLAPNTKYYFQVLADGTCASAIDDFWTESNEVSIVEWEKEAVIVDINTDVSDANDVSILVENQTTHGSNNKNIADDLFFSKYYEATGQVKLVAIFNGTKDTLSLANIKIHIGQEAGKSSTNTKWDRSISLQSQGKFKEGFIAPNEEIILWCKGSSNVDESIISCVKGKMDVNIMREEAQVVFSGRQTIALSRNDKIIDIMGAVSTNDADITKSFPMKGNCRPTWGDMKSDEFTWCGTGYSIEDKTTEIELSMNRCLLVRSNKVKSGANAVANNVNAFNTLTKDEWLGRQVLKGDDNGITESCNGFAYVADFNYNDYYTTYDSVAKLEIKGNRNADGTYTIPVPRMDTMACTNMRLQLKKAGVVIASREYKVPIVVDKSIDTQNATYFGGNKLTDEVCATCDVVVRDKARLEHVAGGRQQFREMYVYAGSTFTIPEGQSMTLDKVRMFARNDSVSYAIINNSNATDAAISVKEVSHVKRIDGKYWYPFSLPYDCNIADIDQLSGQTLGVYDEDWGIKFYDGKRRQSDGNSTTHYGEVSKYWTMMPEDSVLKAYTGYIIGLFYPDENLMRSVNFPPATLSAYTEDATSKSTTITNWPDNLAAQPRHRGWNFVGSPYISLFGIAEGEGLNNSLLTMGWTDAYGERQDKENIYVSIPDGGNSNTYTQALASGVTIKPFTAYFVQAIDPTDDQSHTLLLTYSKTNRHLLASPARAAADASPLILAELDIRCGALHDNTGVLVNDVYSTDYEIGDDLTKMYAAAQKPQLYTIDAHNDKMAYQALPDVLAHAIPLGIYVPQAGDYTLSLNRYVSRLDAAEAVYLLHNGTVVANLLLSDYTVSASAKGTISGYSLDIRRAPEVVTDIVPAAGDAPYIIARDGVLAIANLPADAIVQVYDVLGHQLLRADTYAAGTLQVPVPQTGVYTVVITTAGQQVLKTLLR